MPQGLRVNFGANCGKIVATLNNRVTVWVKLVWKIQEPLTVWHKLEGPKPRIIWLKQPPETHFRPFQAWVPKVLEIDTPRAHFQAFLAWVPTVAEIGRAGRHFLPFLARVPKVAEIESPRHQFLAFLGKVPGGSEFSGCEKVCLNMPGGPKTSKTRASLLKRAWRSQGLKDARRSA